ncbi:MAG: glycosyltransferase family 8 protein [Massiliimalia sp.]|jgi:UDP-glucose:(galactosyl)LPS alpha-1,2-glucosyltransferase
MNILVTLNQGYLSPLKVMLYSLIREHQQTQLDVYLAHSSLTSEQVEQIKKIFCKPYHRLHNISIDDNFFQGMPVTSRYPTEMYYRIFAAQYLPEELDRILYLDPDIVVIRPLDDLYQISFGDHLFAAASHAGNVLRQMNEIRLGTVVSPKRVKQLASGHKKGTQRIRKRLWHRHMNRQRMVYINSGVMMLNLSGLRQEQNLNKIMDYLKHHESVLWYPDQDLISAVYQGKILELDTLKYNLNERTFRFFQARPKLFPLKLDFHWVQENSCIIHYCGRNKPWKPDYFGEFGVFYQEAQEQLKQEFPEIV